MVQPTEYLDFEDRSGARSSFVQESTGVLRLAALRPAGRDQDDKGLG